MKVLIAYGTRYGSTEEISQEIAKILEDKGFKAEIFNLGIIKPKNWPRLDDFDGVLVGTSLKINSWKKQVKTFIEKNKEKLKALKFGVFTCGAWAIVEPIDAHEDIARRLTKNFELKADIYNAFGGVLDFSEDSKVGRVGKLALKATALGLEKDKDIPVDKEKLNDFRDWDKIQRFAADFAGLLQ
ncbi:MAG: flavodoxin domain-containing protein [Candidatus Lokiarchaeota archaeon]|nr:flavodoxin domain-containing protein [Candidatus Lokiarchaeota archaeon]